MKNIKFLLVTLVVLAAGCSSSVRVHNFDPADVKPGNSFTTYIPADNLDDVRRVVESQPWDES